MIAFEKSFTLTSPSTGASSVSSSAENPLALTDNVYLPGGRLWKLTCPLESTSLVATFGRASRSMSPPRRESPRHPGQRPQLRSHTLPIRPVLVERSQGHSVQSQPQRPMPQRTLLAKILKSWSSFCLTTQPYSHAASGIHARLAHPLRPGLGNVRLLRRSDL